MCLVEVSGPAGRHPAAGVLRGGHRGHGGRHHLRQGQEGPGRRARVPARQPPARLPGLRQGRRVPAAGPDPRLRPGREPLRRGEAPLREAHRHLRAGAARPRALHPVRPLHPVRRGGGRRGPDRLRRAGRAGGGGHLPRASRSPPTSAATPCRSARWARSPPPPTGSPPGRGTSTRWSPRAPPARSAAGWPCSRRPTGSPGCSASTPTRSTRAGCATRAASLRVGQRRRGAAGPGRPPTVGAASRCAGHRPFPARPRRRRRPAHRALVRKDGELAGGWARRCAAPGLRGP